VAPSIKYTDPDGKWIGKVAGVIGRWIISGVNPITAIALDLNKIASSKDVGDFLKNTVLAVTGLPDPSERLENLSKDNIDAVTGAAPSAPDPNDKNKDKDKPDLKHMPKKQVKEFLDAGEDCHQNGEKPKFTRRFLKQLKGDDNPDFYFDKNTGEIFLKGVKNGVEVPTGEFIKL